MGLKGLTKSVPLASPETSVLDACRMMDEAKVGALAVVDGNRFSGIFTYRDLIQRVLLEKLDLETTPLGEVMTRNPVTLRTTEGYGDALRLMVARDYTYVPVVGENGRPAGLLSLQGLLQHEIDHLANELDSVMHYLGADGAGGD